MNASKTPKGTKDHDKCSPCGIAEFNSICGCTVVNPAPSCSHSSCYNFGFGQEAGCVSKRVLVVKLSSGFYRKTKRRVRKYLAILENPKMWTWTEDFLWYNKLFCFFKLKHCKKTNYFLQIFFLPNDDTLIFSINNHVSVHAVCKSINMWWIFILCLGEEIKNNFSRQH